MFFVIEKFIDASKIPTKNPIVMLSVIYLKSWNTITHVNGNRKFQMMVYEEEKNDIVCSNPGTK